MRPASWSLSSKAVQRRPRASVTAEGVSRKENRGGVLPWTLKPKGGSQAKGWGLERILSKDNSRKDLGTQSSGFQTSRKTIAKRLLKEESEASKPNKRTGYQPRLLARSPGEP